jgi:hypothetical protein
MIFGILLFFCYRFPNIGFGGMDKEQRDSAVGCVFTFGIFEMIFEGMILTMKVF